MDLEAQIRSLQNDYGSSHGPNSPGTFRLELWIGSPNTDDGYEVPTTYTDYQEDGTEFTAVTGYVATLINNNGAQFPPPDPDTGELVLATVSYPTSADGYPDAVSHWLLRDPATGSAWDYGSMPRAERVVVAPGVTPAIIPVIGYGSPMDAGD